MATSGTQTGEPIRFIKGANVGLSKDWAETGMRRVKLGPEVLEGVHFIS